MVGQAVRDEISRLPAAVQETGLAHAVITLADRLDDAAPRDTAPIARELRNAMADLAKAAESKTEEVDPVDDLASRRAARVEKSGASKRAERAADVGSGGKGPGGKRGTGAGPAAG